MERLDRLPADERDEPVDDRDQEREERPDEEPDDVRDREQQPEKHGQPRTLQVVLDDDLNGMPLNGGRRRPWLHSRPLLARR
jgi:hypothetical protein